MTTQATFTRKDYMDNVCTHEEYYSQFVNNNVKAIVLNRFSESELSEALAEDQHLNSIPLRDWDYLAAFFSISKSKLAELGEGDSLSTRVCILKQAAIEIVNNIQ